MQKPFGILLSALILTACAGNEADIEKASYLLGKGGKANAVEAAAILESLKTACDNGEITGIQALEIYRMYAGAKMGAAGFDSVTIVSSLIFSGDSQFVNSISDAIGDELEADAAALLGEASDALDSAIGNAAYSAATTEDRVKRGLQFQRALVDMLKSVRVLISVSGFNEESFTADNCEAALADVTTINSGVESMTNARDRLSRDANGVNLGADNEFVDALDEVLAEIDQNGDGKAIDEDSDDLARLCQYLQDQKGAQ